MTFPLADNEISLTPITCIIFIFMALIFLRDKSFIITFYYILEGLIADRAIQYISVLFPDV